MYIDGVQVFTAKTLQGASDLPTANIQPVKVSARWVLPPSCYTVWAVMCAIRSSQWQLCLWLANLLQFSRSTLFLPLPAPLELVDRGGGANQASRGNGSIPEVTCGAEGRGGEGRGAGPLHTLGPHHLIASQCLEQAQTSQRKDRRCGRGTKDVSSCFFPLTCA